MKKKLTKTDKMRIGAVLIVLLLGVGIIGLQKVLQKEPPIKTEENLEMEEPKRFTFENIKKSEEKTLTLTVKNPTEEEKLYSVVAKEVRNELNNFSNLTYDLYVNENRIIHQEIFPTMDMPLYDAATIQPNSVLLIKIIISYQNTTDSTDLGKNISGKIAITLPES